ncbi:hypothetical protein AUJ84_00405 [Candidatus Pacearchaeota archaeon CG1_02_32_132]|nr:MAG: hypothetical protein AUJ84_00405 [Candidatus Pacearchaeota archaeon CG1_02_32_132]
MDTKAEQSGSRGRYSVLTLRKDGEPLDFVAGADLILAAGPNNVVMEYKNSNKDTTFALVATDDPSRLYNRITRAGISIVDSKIIQTRLNPDEVYTAIYSATNNLSRDSIRHLERYLERVLGSGASSNSSRESKTEHATSVQDLLDTEPSGISIFDTGDSK